MNSAKASKLKDDYYKLQENEEMKKLNEVLGIEWGKGIVWRVKKLCKEIHVQQKITKNNHL